MVLEKMPHSLEVAANPPPEDFEHPNIVSDGGGEEAGRRRGGQEDIRSDKRVAETEDEAEGREMHLLSDVAE